METEDMVCEEGLAAAHETLRQAGYWHDADARYDWDTDEIRGFMQAMNFTEKDGKTYRKGWSSGPFTLETGWKNPADIPDPSLN